MSKQDKYTKSAKGEDCQIRLPGICSFNQEETIFAHINGGGMGSKHSSIHGAYACSKCHDCVDFRVPSEFPKELIELWFLEGVIRTQIIMIDKGLIKF